MALTFHAVIFARVKGTKDRWLPVVNWDREAFEYLPRDEAGAMQALVICSQVWPHYEFKFYSPKTNPGIDTLRCAKIVADLPTPERSESCKT
jgi:hypothetical protein